MGSFDDELNGANVAEGRDSASGYDGEVRSDGGDGDETEVGASGEKFFGALRWHGVVELVPRGECEGAGRMLEVPHEWSGIEEVDSGDANGMGRDGSQEASLVDETGEDGVLRAIIGFERDEEGHWVARLECGHGQHVRHDPPWMVREWVTTEAGRASRLGVKLDCKKCGDGEQV